MLEPLIVVTKARVKEGKLGDFMGYYEKIVQIVEANEPRVIAFNGFLNEDGTQMTSIQVHPDTASMDFHCKCSGTTGMIHTASTSKCSRSSASTTTGHLPKPLWTWTCEAGRLSASPLDTSPDSAAGRAGRSLRFGRCARRPEPGGAHRDADNLALPPQRQYPYLRT